jgi:lipopolysaccharide biosynthesis glycosyltransferase
MILLVTLAIGREYLELYQQKFMSSHEQYAKKHGYDFQVLTYYPEAPFMKEDYPKNYTTISFHKILVCSQEWSEQYDKIIFIDADILINKDAPPIHNFLEFGDKIGVVDEFAQPSCADRIAIQKNMGWETSSQEYYRLCGLDMDSPTVINTGLLVFQPKKHRKLLEDIFQKYIHTCENHPRGFIFEQTVISYELLKQNAFVLLPSAFNTIWALYKWNTPSLDLHPFFRKTWFLHFAGKIDIEKVEALQQ